MDPRHGGDLRREARRGGRRGSLGLTSHARWWARNWASLKSSERDARILRSKMLSCTWKSPYCGRAWDSTRCYWCQTELPSTGCESCPECAREITPGRCPRCGSAAKPHDFAEGFQSPPPDLPVHLTPILTSLGAMSRDEGGGLPLVEMRAFLDETGVEDPGERELAIVLWTSYCGARADEMARVRDSDASEDQPRESKPKPAPKTFGDG